MTRDVCIWRMFDFMSVCGLWECSCVVKDHAFLALEW